MATEQSFPVCAICNKPVDELTTIENPHHNTFDITASCHGDVETVAVPMSTFILANSASFGGVAFAPKQSLCLAHVNDVSPRSMDIRRFSMVCYGQYQTGYADGITGAPTAADDNAYLQGWAAGCQAQ